MAILIDPPTWPAHGTTFAHLVSDTSLAELHEFAVSAGIPERAFDLDHYDVPAHRYQDLVDQGAQPVSARELTRRLRASGLRVPARDRPERLRGQLSAAWQEVTIDAGLSLTEPAFPETSRAPIPRTPAADERSDGAVADLGSDLLERWNEPHRRYHDLRHLRDVLAALDLLCQPEPAPAEVRLAAWFHDAVYVGRSGADEQASAELARASLGPDALGTAALSNDRIEEVVRLVLLTTTHRPEPGDTHGALLCDADLSVLAREAAGYHRYTADVRAEYTHVPEADFITGRRAVVRHLLDAEPLYHTMRGQQLWQQRARANLRAEMAALTQG